MFRLLSIFSLLALVVAKPILFTDINDLEFFEPEEFKSKFENYLDVFGASKVI